MPCNSEYIDPTDYEKNLSLIYTLEDELAGYDFNKVLAQGFHPNVYGLGHREDLNTAVSRLCAILQTKDVTKYSLEMQIWWRDHQSADKVRLKKEYSALLTEAEAAGIALNKAIDNMHKWLVENTKNAN